MTRFQLSRRKCPQDLRNFQPHSILYQGTQYSISKKVNDLAQAIDNLEAYSYRYNLKLVGIPELPDETATATANVCVLGASVTTHDIDIAHRLPKRSTRSEDERSSQNAIICKFTRQLPLQEIMQQRV